VPNFLYAQHVERDGKLLVEEVCSRNLEGIVAKRRMGRYAEHGWLKIKNPKYAQAEGRQDMFQAFQRRSRRVAHPCGLCKGGAFFALPQRTLATLPGVSYRWNNQSYNFYSSFVYTFVVFCNGEEKRQVGLCPPRSLAILPPHLCLITSLYHYFVSPFSRSLSRESFHPDP
jgi:hypothetical protein